MLVSRHDTAAVIESLAAQLAAAGYTPGALQQAFGARFPDDVGLLNHAPALERVQGDRAPAAVAIRLFFLEADVPAARIASLFSRRACQALVDAGVLQRCAGGLRARVRIDPVGTQYFVADRRFRGCDARALRLHGRDPVYPPSSDSLMLRDAVVDIGGGCRILDVCTGSGVQALQHARAAAHVIAVDINPRAAAIARLNARLNGVGNVEVRAGDLFGPVRGEVFDVIIANPPFVASPYAAAASYHAGGPRGDRVLRRIIAGLPGHLRPGGRAFAISHVALRSGEPLEPVAARWFRGFPGRAVVLRLETGSAVDLAAAQSLFAMRRGLAVYGSEVKRWVVYLRHHRIESIALLLVVAERAGRAGLEIVEAQPRVLSLPVSPPPAERIRTWLGEVRREAQSGACS